MTSLTSSDIDPVPKGESPYRILVDFLSIGIRGYRYVILTLLSVAVLRFLGIIPEGLISEYLGIFVSGATEYVVYIIAGALFGLVLCDHHFDKYYRPTYRAVFILGDNDVAEFKLIPEEVFKLFKKAGNSYVLQGISGMLLYVANGIDYEKMEIDYGFAHQDKWINVIGKREFFNAFKKSFVKDKKLLAKFRVSISAQSVSNKDMALCRLLSDIDKAFCFEDLDMKVEPVPAAAGFEAGQGAEAVVP